MLRPKRLAVCIPLLGDMPSEAAAWHLKAAADAARLADEVKIVVVHNVCPYDRARIALMTRAVEAGCDWGLLLDADTLLPVGGLERLLTAAGDHPDGWMFSGHYLRRGYPYTSVWSGTLPGGQLTQLTATRGVHEIKWTGLGAALVDMRKVAGLQEPWFAYGAQPNGTQVSEDLWFCDRIRDAGGKIYGVAEVRCGHVMHRGLIADDNADELRRQALATQRLARSARTLPYAAQIETTTRCVGVCEFCPHKEVVEGRPEFMTIETYEKVLERVAEAGCFRDVYLFGNGDPLCDPRLPELVDKIPCDYRVYLFTTLGMKLSDAMVAATARCQVVLSAADLTPQGQALRDQNMQRVKVREVHATTTRVELGRKLAQAVNRPLKVVPVYNWMGQVDSEFKSVGRCSRPREHMYVLSDGRVALCCLDARGEYALGNLLTETVRDIWSKPLTQRYCTEDRSGLAGCQRCNHPEDGLVF